MNKEELELVRCDLHNAYSWLNAQEQENKQLKEQLEYIRSGEYYNQLRFERNMLQDLVDKGGISKEDKEFIDCTHRNTELLEIIDKAIEFLEPLVEIDMCTINGKFLKKPLEILKGKDE